MLIKVLLVECTGIAGNNSRVACNNREIGKNAVYITEGTYDTTFTNGRTRHNHRMRPDEGIFSDYDTSFIIACMVLLIYISSSIESYGNMA